MGLFSRKEKLDLDFTTTLHERNKYTPDIAKLQEHCFQLLFVYDRMQQGFYEHDQLLLEHSVKAATAFTDKKFVMLKKPLHNATYPVILRRDDWKRLHHLPRRVQGELFYVLSEQFRELDKIQMNGVQYNRELIDIFIPFVQLKKMEPSRESGVPKAEYEKVFGTAHPSEHVKAYTVRKAYCYVGNDDHWEPFANDMDMEPARWLVARDQKVGEYYSFRKRLDTFDG